MRLKVAIAVVCAPLAGSFSTYAANPTAAAVYTFMCNGRGTDDSGHCPDGGRPGALIQGSDGNFYGTAQVSSAGGSAAGGGTIFALTPAGQFTVLHKFVPGSGGTYPNGNVPGTIMEGPDGNLYGSTFTGGSANMGVLYRISKQGTNFQVIHQFCSATNCTDGESPTNLVLAYDGNLYGATTYGGTQRCYESGCGTIFRVTPSSGDYQVVYNFTSNGSNPIGLTRGPDGLLYGLAGSMFRFNLGTGAVESTLLQFPSGPSGLAGRAASGLILGPNGKFFGLYEFECIAGVGLFEVDPDGSNVTAFPQFGTSTTIGGLTAMFLGSDGNIWLAASNGSTGYGSILAISTATGAIALTLSPFDVKTALGAYPAALIEASDGTFWGTTSEFGNAPSGQFGEGVAYSLNVGL